MLRDRIPVVDNAALKWCGAKTKWINYVYDTYMKFLIDKSDRNSVCRNILGLAKSNRNFVFHKTIEWSDLSEEETKYWKNVNNWVEWFEKTLILISDERKIKILKGFEEEEIKAHICAKFMNNLSPEWQNKLYDYCLYYIKYYDI